MSRSLIRLLLPVLWLAPGLSCTTKENPKDGTCGNGTLELTEECDGDRFWGQTCEGYGFRGGFLGCGPFCTVDVSTCHGYLPTCGNGLVEELESCDTTELSGVTCESWGFEGGTLSCTVACTFDTSACLGSCSSSCILGSRRCVGDRLEVCEASPGACNAWAPEQDCAESQQGCVQLTFRTAECQTLCEEPCVPGARRCSDDGGRLLTCAVTGDGDCFVWEEEPCVDGQVCVVGRETRCQDPCADPCTAPQEGAWRCSADGRALEACLRAGEDCRRWVWQSDCDAGEVCLPWLVSCETQGAGDTCADARWAPFPSFSLSGDDFAADFTDDATTLAQGEGCQGQTQGPDAFWRMRLAAGETVVVSAVRGPGFRFRVHPDCDALGCLADDARLVFTSPGEGEFVFSAEGWGIGTGAYEIRVEPAVWVQPGQPCLTDDPAAVCESSYCAADARSPTGYACRGVDGGDLCEDARVAVSGVSWGALQGLTDAVVFPSYPGAVEQWWSFTATADGTHVITLGEAGFAANLLAFQTCADVPDVALAAVSGAGALELRLPLTAGASLRIAVEKATGFASSSLPYAYRLQVRALAADETGLCADGLDNDDDALVDCADPDCAGVDPACLTESACGDAIDDDGDALVDCDDPDCAAWPACQAVKALYSQMNDWEPSGFEGRRLRFLPRPGMPREYDWVLEEPAAFFVSPGTAGVGMAVVDDGLYPLTLPMRFPFFGGIHDSVWVSSNGWISFEAPGGAHPYESPSLLVERPMIALMWDDLSRVQFGDEFHADWGYDSHSGRVFWSFTFYCREYTSPDHRLWAQVVLFDDGEIRFDYLICGIQDGIVGIAAPGLGPIPAPIDFLP